jgi:cobyrinic acid a,c-diamide synthase
MKLLDKELNIPRLVIAGTTSGVGKTSITSAIIFGIKKRGYSVQPFKVGPDYIDPSYLSSISKNDAKNLDVWLMGENELVQSFVKNSASDVSVIEGVMGYYDGFGGKDKLCKHAPCCVTVKGSYDFSLGCKQSSSFHSCNCFGVCKISSEF